VILSALPCKEAPMNVRYVVTLTEAERDELKEMVAKGSKLARKVKKAQLLLAADGGASDEEIARLVVVGTSTVYRAKRRFVEEGIAAALSDRPRPGAERKLSGKDEALLMATACSKPPPGRARWTLELLAGELVRLTDHDSVSAETVRRRLHEKDIKPWQKKMWCVPAIDGEYVARMENVLDLYTEPPDPSFPVICFDESPTQLIGEKRLPIPARAGTRERYDYEYRRNGTANLFVFLDAHRPWRQVKVTDRRTALDFAECMRDLVDVHYPDTHRIRVVLDNLSTHVPGNLYEAFPAAEAHRILNRLEFHYTPKHASWLNMVEIEIGVLRTMCLARRIADRATLEREVATWVRQRNASKARVRWLFDVEQARRKLARAYPTPSRLSVKSAA
jgi:transposase